MKNVKVKSDKRIIKVLTFILVILFFSLLLSLSIKIYFYENGGDNQFFWETHAKCDRSYNCVCSKYSKKCNCIYYDDERGIQEKIKCTK